jgi:hypothetical protein
MKDPFIEKYGRIYEEVKPLNYIEDVIVIIILSPTFFIMTPLIIAAFRTKWSNMKIDMKIAMIMVFFDVGSAFDAMMVHFDNLIHIPWNYPTQLSCTINSLFSLFTFFNSTSLVGLLSMERCILIVYKKHYSDRFYYIIILILIMLNIGICTLAALTSGFDLIPIGTYCLFTVYTVGGIVGSLLTGGLVGCSLFATFFGYIKICIFRREQSKKAQIELGLDPVKVQKEVNSTILKSLSIIIVSALANGPYTLIFLLQIASESFNTPQVYLAGTVLINLNVTLNSLILINMKPELYKEIKRMYGFNVDS